ncbi:MAG: TRAP transporter substrate-binding protein [Lachnospiraceae bacterium]|nr:TRAP transporter substrate-binding protein [Lachnospiraceae bacterium]
MDKSKLKRWSIAVAAGLMLITAVIGLAACKDKGKKGADGSIKLDIGISFPKDDWRSAYIQDFAEELTVNSKGAMKTQIHYIDEYSDMMDLLNELDKNSSKLDIILCANAYLADVSVPDFYLTGLPYLFKDFEDAWAFSESDINSRIEAKLPEYGMRVLAHFCGGFRNLAAVRQINTPDDMAGLVVATVKSPLMMDMLSELGADPQVSIVGELYDSVKKGIYTGVEISLATLMRDKDYQVLPYVSVTNHAYNLWSLLIDEDTWKELSEDNRKIMKETAEKYAAEERLASKKNAEDIVEQLRQYGATVNYPDHELFKSATRKVREQYSADYAAAYREAEKFLKDLA